MARKSYRSGRIGEEIKRVIGEMLLRELKDPRFSGFVSVTGVKAADDGSFATVYITMLGTGVASAAAEGEKRDVLRAFDSAKGLIRRELGARLQLRRTPDLQFKFDTSGEYGRHIEEIIHTLSVSGAASAGETIKENVSMEELARVALDAHSVHIFPHENIDGDTLGSSVALCLALKDLGKDCRVVVGEKIPDNLRFIENGCTAHIGETNLDEIPDLSILMDVGETSRLNGRAELLKRAETTVCIDHHISSKAIYDYNFIDADAAATAEIVFDLIEALDVSVDERIATALYVGILTDTGGFRYSNTTEKTHRAAAALLSRGVSPGEVSVEIYENIRIEKLHLENAVMDTMEVIAGGKGVIAYMTREMLARTGAMDEETEGIVEKLRTIRDVEVAVFVREPEDGRTKVSMRSKSYYDVAALAGRFGGGGHVRAAGFSAKRPLTEVLAELKKTLIETIQTR
jgi:phosphoesterase RecJ-like protein